MQTAPETLRPFSGRLALIGRYYDPSTSQFLSVDPLVDQTLQPYGYANENPANHDDPTGLWSCENPLSGPGLTQQEANAAVLQQCGTGYNNAYPYNQHYPWYDVATLTYFTASNCVTAHGNGPIPTNVGQGLNLASLSRPYTVAYDFSASGPSNVPQNSPIPPGLPGILGQLIDELQIVSRLNSCLHAGDDPTGQALTDCVNPN